MPLATPDWIARRDGTVKIGSDNKTYFLIFGGQPHYSFVPVPAEGKFTCAIRQTESGRRFTNSTLRDSAEDAVKSGLDELGKELGWL